MATVHDYSYYQKQFNNLVDPYNPWANTSLNPDANYNIYSDPNYLTALQNAMTSQIAPTMPNQRTLLGRALDLVSTPLYATSGFVKGLVDNGQAGDISPWQGFVQGLRAGNPFGPGYDQGKYDYSQVLETMGWQPTTLFGKIARGVVGFGLDVLLDPTTYLSGGTSALLKGTGAVGRAGEALAKLGEDSSIMTHVGQKAADRAYFEALAGGADALTAENAASDAFRTAATQPVTHMTPDMAESIILNHNRTNGLSISQEQLAKDSQNLADKYNKVIGARTNAQDLTWSLGNVPFGDKIFGWTGLADKKVTLASAESLQNLSHQIGLAQTYAGIRDSIYGSKIGELFSTTSPLYQAAQTDPSKLYDVLRFQNMVQGRNLDKVQAEKQIRDFASQLNFTPAESKEILNLLQNKTIWGKVQATLKFTDTQEAQQLQSAVVGARDSLQSELDSMQQDKNALDALRTAQDQGLIDAHDQIDALQNEFHQKLTSVDSTHLTNQADLQRQMKMLQDEIDRAHATAPEEVAATTTSEVKQPVSPQDVIDAHQTWQKQLKDVQAYHDLQKTASTTSKDSEEYLKAQDTLSKLQGAPHQGGRFDTIDKLSEYVFGKPGQIVHSAYQNDVEGALKLIQDGADRAAVRDYITSRPAMMSSKYQQIYSHLGERFGYGQGKEFTSWQAMHDAKIKPIEDAIQTSQPVTEHEIQTLHDWAKQNLDRSVLRNKLTKMSDEQLRSYLTNYANQKMLEDVTGISHLMNTTAKGGVRTPEEARFNENMVRANEVGRNDKQLTPSQIFRNTEGHTDAYNTDSIMTAIMSRIPKENRANPRLASFIKGVTDEAKILEKDMGVRYVDMTPAQRRMVMDMAISNSNKRALGEEVQRLGNAEEVKQAALKEAQTRAVSDHIDAIQKEVQIGSEIHYIPGGKGRPIRGVVDAIKHDDQGRLVYEVHNVKDDVTQDVPIGDVAGVLRQNQPVKTTEEVIQSTQMSHQVVADTTKLNEQLGKLRHKLASSRATHAAQRDALAKSYQERLAPIQKHMQDLEMDKMQFDQASYDANVSMMEAVSKRIAKYDDILSNDDAFESYAKMKLGEDKFNEITSSDSGKIYLDDMAVSEKVKDIVKTLRESFMQMAQEEIRIGKLDAKQADNLMYDYVAHILTPEGEKFFGKQKNVEKTGTFLTNELGYGRKFNPHSMQRQIKDLEINGKVVHNPTIDQINEYFKDYTRGANVFSDTISDIWIARALKHSELMYDDQYMHDMLDNFGKGINPDGTAEKGFKVVMNHGIMRANLYNLAGLQLSIEQSWAVSNFLHDNYFSIRQEVQKSLPLNAPQDVVDKAMSDALSQARKDFVDQNYSEEQRMEKYRTYFEDSLKQTGISQDVLDRAAVPMVEFKPEQATSFKQYYEKVWQDHYDMLKFMEDKARSRAHYLDAKPMIQNFRKQGMSFEEARAQSDQIISESERWQTQLAQVYDLDGGVTYQRERIAEFINKHPQSPQIKQVSELIVNKANNARKLQIAKDTNRLGQLYDRWLHFTKLGMTVVSPAFHMRNSMSNSFLNWLGVGSDALNPKVKIRAVRTVMNMGDVHKSPQDLWEIAKPDGSKESLTWPQMFEMAQQYGVIDTGLMKRDVQVGSASGHTGVLNFLKPQHDPTDTKNFVAYKWGTKMGTWVENSDRLIHFASMLRQGATPEQAAESVNKFLFDYGDLTSFEQNVMKRIIPFYTWLRKNSRLQVSQYLENPKAYQLTAKALNNVTGMNNAADQIDWNITPPWTQGAVQLPFSVMINHVQEPVIWNANMLPISNISDLPDPFHPLASAENMLNQVNPMFKVPLEQALNYSFYLGHPIAQTKTDATGKLTSPPLWEQRLNNVAGNNSGLHAISGLNTTDANQFAFNLFNDFSGIKLIPFDYQTYKKQYAQQLQQSGK